MAIINGTSGPDPLDGTSGDDEIYGFAGNDILRGLLGNDYIDGGADNDFIDGGAGFDTMLGGTGNDTFVVDSFYDVVTEAAGEGSDTIYAYSDFELAAGSEVERLSSVDWRFTNSLQLTGNEIANILEGNRGSNYLNGGGGADTLVGFEGDDVYIVDNAGDVVLEDGDENSLSGLTRGGSDTVLTSVSYTLARGSFVEELSASDIGGTSPLVLTGNELANVLRGNAGANTFYDGGGRDLMYGYGGNDIYVVTDSFTTMVELAGNGSDVVYTVVSYQLGAGISVERLSTMDWSSTDAINLTGNELSNLIEGNAGQNQLRDGGGADILVGFGGPDDYFVTDSSVIVREAVGGGTDAVATTVDYTLTEGSEIENLGASAANLRLTGNEFNNILAGSGGDDILFGGGGSDMLFGNNGNDVYIVNDATDQVSDPLGGNDTVYSVASYTLADNSGVETLSSIDWSLNLGLTLTGNNQANTIHGDAGANFIDGKGSNDILVGKAGADTFAFTTAIGVFNTDSIADFQAGVDKIALDDAIFTGLSPGALPAGAFVLGTSAGDADDRIIYDAATGRIFYDANGNGAGGSVLFATVTAGTALTASDFTVI
jgi:Ca2+-binding RTX toxin-like protein